MDNRSYENVKNICKRYGLNLIELEKEFEGDCYFKAELKNNIVRVKLKNTGRIFYDTGVGWKALPNVRLGS